MTNKQAIEILTLELWHTESHKKIEGKATEYYEELSQIAEALKMAIEALKDERPQGEWINRRIISKDRSFDMVVCSNCQTEFSWDAETGVSMDNYNTCPNCGANMKEADNEQ